MPILAQVFKDGDNNVKISVLQMTWRYGNKSKEILAEAATVLNLEGTIDDMMNMMHAHPTVWEGMGDAFASVRGLQINV